MFLQFTTNLMLPKNQKSPTKTSQLLRCSQTSWLKQTFRMSYLMLLILSIEAKHPYYLHIFAFLLQLISAHHSSSRINGLFCCIPCKRLFYVILPKALLHKTNDDYINLESICVLSILNSSINSSKRSCILSYKQVEYITFKIVHQCIWLKYT